MKRILISTTIAASLSASAAFALSDFDKTAIEIAAPYINAEMLTDAEGAELLNIIHGGAKRGERRAKLKAFLENNPKVEAKNDTSVTFVIPTTGITDVERATIRPYAPDANLSELSDEQVASILNIIHGGSSVSERMDKVDSIIGN